MLMLPLLIFLFLDKTWNNLGNNCGESWSLHSFLKDLHPQSTISSHNSLDGFSSNNSSSNNALPKRGNGKRHVFQICGKVGHQATQ